MAAGVTGNAVALLSTVLWSSSFPATEYLLRAWDPLLLGVARLAGAATFLLALALLAGQARDLAAGAVARRAARSALSASPPRCS